MSRTIRAVDHGWEPGDPEFDKWNSSRPANKQCQSKKHQCSDRKGRGKEGGKHGRFCNHLKNSKYNLLRKNDNLAFPVDVHPE